MPKVSKSKKPKKEIEYEEVTIIANLTYNVGDVIDIPHLNNVGKIIERTGSRVKVLVPKKATKKSK